MTPEQESRELIDAKLASSGWIVQTYKEMNLGAGRGLAVTEFPGAHGPADYLLYVDGKALGVVEAKPVGHTLTGVEGQSAAYADGLATRTTRTPTTSSALSARSSASPPPGLYSFARFGKVLEG